MASRVCARVARSPLATIRRPSGAEGTKPIASLLRTHPGVLRVATPATPTGQRLVASIDADQLAVLRADVDATAVHGGLETRRRFRFPRLHDLAVLVHAKHVALERRHDEVTARSGWRRAQKPALL